MLSASVLINPVTKCMPQCKNIFLCQWPAKMQRNKWMKLYLMGEMVLRFHFEVCIINDDINIDVLIHQLQLLPIILSSCKDTSIHDIFVMVRNMSKAKRVIISEVVTLLKLLIPVVVSATNAESERGFSTMRRIKKS